MTYSLGSQYDKGNKGVYFTLFSAYAKKIELCLFCGGKESCYPLLKQRGHLWSLFLPGVLVGVHYGYRVYGDDQNGEEQYLLIDPYSKAINIEHSPMLSIVVDDDYDWQDDQPPNTPWPKTIIYEAHVKGLTQLHTDIPEAIRGTYSGLAHPIMIDYLTKLGITAIELLPIQQHLDEGHLANSGLSNYWGYNVIAPFAVESRYWSKTENTTPITEFKDTVKVLHKASIEVILDVVFNHTAELDKSGPTLCLKGIDKQSYYWLDEKDEFINWTGCGNTLKFTQPEVIQWFLDCLRYWVQEFHIDGFRFDLGTILGRTPTFSVTSPLFIALLQDPILKTIKLISEPWDIGPKGYQLGQFPYRFSEWNDHYRDEIRRFWLHGNISIGQFAQRFAASSDLFNNTEKTPCNTVNFLACHDGFTLNDVVSFQDKHNQKNKENNEDGNNCNWSHNFGIEGNQVPDNIKQLRFLAQKNLLTTLFLSQGTPMLLAGDEWGNSQQGNNNGYCQDNEVTWLNWQNKNEGLLKEVISLIKIRKQIPALNHNQWWKTDNEVCWLNRLGQTLSYNEWQDDKELTLQIELSKNWLIVINGSNELKKFSIADKNWQCVAGKIEQMATEPHYWQTNAKTISILNHQYEETLNG